MTYEDYKSYIEELLDDTELSLSPSVINRLARRAVEAQNEPDFTIADVFGELSVMIPSKLSGDDDYIDFIDSLAQYVFDEKDTTVYNDEENDDL